MLLNVSSGKLKNSKCCYSTMMQKHNNDDIPYLDLHHELPNIQLPDSSNGVISAVPGSPSHKAYKSLEIMIILNGNQQKQYQLFIGEINL